MTKARRVALLTLLLLGAGCLQAHEIGTSQVNLALHNDHSWTAVIVTAPQTLANRLEAEAGEPVSSGLSAAALRAVIDQHRTQLSRAIEVRFDGVLSPATVTVSRLEVWFDPVRPDFIELRVDGLMPAQAQAVSWRFALVYATYALVLSESGNAEPQTDWVAGDVPSHELPIAAHARPVGRIAVTAQYLRLGFLHILPGGLDHILFVLGIFLLTTRMKPVLVQVTAFTVAHSVTLGLTMYGVIALSPRIVEPLIALSVACVAIENLVTPRLTPWRPVVVFGFGLLHGMGFAGVLGKLRLPLEKNLLALFSFNAGIELAQLTVIVAAYFAVAHWYRDKLWYRTRVVLPSSALMACTGLWWTVQRIVES